MDGERHERDYTYFWSDTSTLYHWQLYILLIVYLKTAKWLYLKIVQIQYICAFDKTTHIKTMQTKNETYACGDAFYRAAISVLWRRMKQSLCTWPLTCSMIHPSEALLRQATTTPFDCFVHCLLDVTTPGSFAMIPVSILDFLEQDDTTNAWCVLIVWRRKLFHVIVLSW